MQTFHLKTHNRWQILLLFIASIFLPIFFFKKHGEVGDLLVSISCLTISMLVSYYLLANTIPIVLGENNIAAIWTSSFPFYRKKFEEISFENIVSVDTSSGRSIFNTFTIETKNGEKLHIHSLNFFIRQKEYVEFIFELNKILREYNKRQNNKINQIRLPVFWNIWMDGKYY